MNDQGIDEVSEHGDDELIAALRRVAIEVDPVPEGLLLAARAAIATRDLDAELAVLVADSAAANDPDADLDPTLSSLAFEQVRTGGQATLGSRLLSFAGGGVQLDVEVSERGGDVDLMGQVIGGSPEECVLEHSGGRDPFTPDALGRFVVSGVRRGPARIRCTSSTGARVTTAWVTI
jgi:hypothetical protein